MKESLFGKTLEELRDFSEGLGQKSFIGNQLADWIYKKKAASFGEMTNLSISVRTQLGDLCEIGLTPHARVQESSDGTKKYLFPVKQGHFVETAYIPETSRDTLCISTQVGCMRGCSFCMTGRQGLQGNLTSGEILNQIHSLPESGRLTNLVYMGMGEPFDNFTELMKSLEILTAPWGYGWSSRRITVSTIGILPAIQEFLKQSACNLAISLHTPFHEERKEMMPVEKAHPVKDIIEDLKNQDISRYRNISFEYILFKDLNDSPQHVNALVRLLDGLRCKVNLISFHNIPGTRLKGLPLKKMIEFKDALNSKGLTATVRKSRGQDIDAACGLLSTREKNVGNNPESP